MKSIEAQHGLLVARATGIYSFSHLTFHEYFAAREIVANSAWERLAEHITEKRWREVFLLTTGMMRKADELMQLMKQKVDSLVPIDNKLQQFLEWVNQKANSLNTPNKLAAVRASYFEIYGKGSFLVSVNKDKVVVVSILFASIEKVKNYQELFLPVEMLIDNLIFYLIDSPLDVGSSYKVLSIVLQNIKSNNKLQQLIQEFQNKLPGLDENDEVLQDWVIYDKWVWTEQLRAVMIEHRNIGHDWQFTDTQKELLQQYYDANKLLVDCLNSDCYVSREVRQEIEDTLLLPARR
ncbi:NACHT domain-containing protein [Scytonema sp. NUACC26]|uniref:NACHT domain-containing protein n=1 Tax=Scytonema sp. NUACC26 TaxID=3140176 RepID=UPI0034DC417E